MEKENIGNQTEPKKSDQTEGQTASLLEKIQNADAEEFAKLDKAIESGEIDLMEDNYEPQEKEVDEGTEANEETEQLQEQEEEPQEEDTEQGTEEKDTEEVKENEPDKEEQAEEIKYSKDIKFHGEDKSIEINDNSIKVPTKFLGEITEDEYTYEELIDELQLAKKQRRDRKIIDSRRRTVQKLEKNDITDEEINLYLELKNGNKEVLSSFLKKSGIDPYDLDIENAKNVEEYDFKDKEEISGVSSKVQDIMRKEISMDGKKTYDETIDRIKEIKPHIPDTVFQKTGQDAQHFDALYTQVKTGNMSKILPKLSRYLDDPNVSAKVQENPDVFWYAYKEVGKNMGIFEDKETAKPADKQVKTTKSEPLNKKKAQASTKLKGSKTSNPKNRTNFTDYTADEIAKMSPEEFDEFSKAVEESS